MHLDLGDWNSSWVRPQIVGTSKLELKSCSDAEIGLADRRK